MTAAVKPLDDTAEGPIKALDLFVIELAPNAVPQVLQLPARLCNLRLRVVAGFVVSGTGRLERSTGVVELLPVIGVVLSLRRNALCLAL
jgi:hypothetical protein